MYKSFFGLTEKPFAITPDPRYLYLSERHAEALAHLAYGITEALTSFYNRSRVTPA